MKHRALRIAWSVAWGIAAVLLVVLWVRSYWWLDSISGSGPGSGIRIDSDYGFLGVEGYPNFSAVRRIDHWNWQTGAPNHRAYSHWTITYYDHGFSGGTSCFVPIWMIEIFFGLFAASSWISLPSYSRFSLRTLLSSVILRACSVLPNVRDRFEASHSATSRSYSIRLTLVPWGPR